MEKAEGLRGVGEVWVVDAYRCDPRTLRSPRVLRRVLAEIVRALRLHPVGRPQLLRFPGAGGVTAVWMLRESHLALHTFPEWGSACFDLFCCRRLPPRSPWRRALARALDAGRVRVRRFSRPYGR